MSTNLQGKKMGPLVERNILEVEEELDQVKEDQDGEFVMPDNQFDPLLQAIWENIWKGTSSE